MERTITTLTLEHWNCSTEDFQGILDSCAQGLIPAHRFTIGQYREWHLAIFVSETPNDQDLKRCHKDVLKWREKQNALQHSHMKSSLAQYQCGEPCVLSEANRLWLDRPVYALPVKQDRGIEAIHRYIWENKGRQYDLQPQRIGDLVQVPEALVWALPGLARSSVTILKEGLAHVGLSLGMNVERWDRNLVKDRDLTPELLATPIATLPFSKPFIKAMEDYKVVTLRDLLRLSAYDLKRVPNISYTRIKQAHKVLFDMRLRLCMLAE
jgi:hypothetical protein